MSESRVHKVLIVDDDPALCELVRAILSDDGFVMREASGLKRAREILKAEDISVCVVDLLLKDGSGLDLVKELMGSLTGTIILSGRSDVVDRVIGLEFGADDYVTKPFHHRELLARVKRIVARVEQMRVHGVTDAATGPLRLGRWTIDPVRFAVADEDGNRIKLSKAEVLTIAILVQSRGVVVSRDRVYAAVMGPMARDPQSRRVDVHISTLRKKLSGDVDGGELIRTVHGRGYIVD